MMPTMAWTSPRERSGSVLERRLQAILGRQVENGQASSLPQVRTLRQLRVGRGSAGEWRLRRVRFGRLLPAMCVLRRAGTGCDAGLDPSSRSVPLSVRQAIRAVTVALLVLPVGAGSAS